MAFNDIVKAYENSRLWNARYEMEGELYGRRHILGGFTPAVKQIGNGLARYPKMAAAGAFGYQGGSEDVTMPNVPEMFRGGKMEEAFQESWEQKKEQVKHKTESFRNFWSGNWNDWHAAQQAADFNRKKDVIALPDTNSTISGVAGIAGLVAAKAGTKLLAHHLMNNGVSAAPDMAPSAVGELTSMLPSLGGRLAQAGLGIAALS